MLSALGHPRSALGHPRSALGALSQRPASRLSQWWSAESREQMAESTHHPVMTLDDFQRSAQRTINPSLDDRDRLLDAAAGLAEEAGEVLALVRRHLFQQHPLDRTRLANELGDALWCLSMVAATSGLSLEAIARANIEKLRARYPDGFSSEASIARRDEPETR